MASEPIHIPHAESFGEWFPEFLKKEFAPYPGRGALVARMVISATLTMIIIVTFRIPGGVVGALTAFIFSRDNLASTARSAIIIVAVFLIGALFIPVGARLFASTPETHFLWVGCSLFLVFFLLRRLTNYGIATGLALVVSSVVGIWYLPGPAAQNVELTLYLVGATVIGALVTLCVEVAFYAVYGRDDLLAGLGTRLTLIEELMAGYADGRPVSRATEASLAQFAIVGAVTAVAAWIGTASSRLSYAGVQFAFAFYLIHLSDFSLQTDLTVARDRVLGVLLGITMMWLVFERFSPRSAADEMVRIFVVNIRLLADLFSSTPRADDPASILKICRQRDEIYRRFGEVNAQSDAVPFETGPPARDMAARDRIGRWQTSLRSIYVPEAQLLQFRIFANVDSKSRSFAAFEQDFRMECSRIFLHIAGSLEKQLATHTHQPEPVASLLNRIDSSPEKIEAESSERELALLRLVRTIAQVVDRLQVEAASEGLYDVAQTSAAPLRPLESEGT